MVYMNKFKVVISCRNIDTYNQTLQHLDTYTKFSTPGAKLFQQFLAAKCIRKNINDYLILIEGTNWRLGPDWDDFTEMLHNQWDTSEDVDFTYIRIGDDINDIEQHTGKITSIEYETKVIIGNVHFESFPEKQTTQIIKKLECTCNIHALMRGDGHESTCPETL